MPESKMYAGHPPTFKEEEKNTSSFCGAKMAWLKMFRSIEIEKKWSKFFKFWPMEGKQEKKNNKNFKNVIEIIRREKSERIWGGGM